MKLEIEFINAQDLEEKLRDLLSMGTHVHDDTSKKECVSASGLSPLMEKKCEAEGTVVGSPPFQAKLVPSVKQEQTEAGTPEAPKETEESPKETEESPKETEEAPKEEAKTPDTPPETPPEGGESAPNVTLENLSTVSYPELLAFCTANPAIGVNAESHAPSVFRKLVELRVTKYFESQQ